MIVKRIEALEKRITAINNIGRIFFRQEEKREKNGVGSISLH